MNSRQRLTETVQIAVAGLTPTVHIHDRNGLDLIEFVELEATRLPAILVSTQSSEVTDDAAILGVISCYDYGFSVYVRGQKGADMYDEYIPLLKSAINESETAVDWDGETRKLYVESTLITVLFGTEVLQVNVRAK